MNTAIMTDTNSGITVEEGRELGIYVLPMPVIIDGTSYLEGIDITTAQLFEAMKEERIITTSQPSPGTIIDMWNSILDSGYEEIVYIPMTSSLSGSCQSASLLAEDFGSKVSVVDNHRISVTQRESALEARKMAERGICAKEIKEYLEAAAFQASIYLTVGALKYLQMGGRLSSSAAMIGTLLNIKPILSIQGEMIDVLAKVRGMKTCERKLIEALQDDRKKRFADVPEEKIQLYTAGTMQNKEDIEHWVAAVQAAFPNKVVSYAQLPCSIASHVGPDCKGIGLSVIS